VCLCIAATCSVTFRTKREIRRTANLYHSCDILDICILSHLIVLRNKCVREEGVDIEGLIDRTVLSTGISMGLCS